jgi:type II secretion system protein D
MTGQGRGTRTIGQHYQFACGLLMGLLMLGGYAAADDEKPPAKKISTEERQALSALAGFALDRDRVDRIVYGDQPSPPAKRNYLLTAATEPAAEAAPSQAERPKRQPPPKPRAAQKPETKKAPDAKPADKPVSRDRMLDLLSQLPAGAMNLSGAELEVQVVGDMVIIRGSEQDVQMLELLINLMDQSYERKELRIVQVKEKDANEIAPTVEQAYRIATETPGQREEDKASITALSSSILLVSALPSDIDQIVDIILQVDEIKDELEFEQLVFPLKHRRASEVAEQLTEIVTKIREKQGARGAEQEIQIIPNDANNSLLIIAPEKQREKLQQLIAELDVEPAPGWSERKLTLYPLLHSEADQLADVINELLETSRARDAAEEAIIRRLRISRAMPDGEVVELPPIDLEKGITIIPDGETNSLIVATAEENIEPMGELIRLLDDVPMAEDFNVRIFPLRYANAEKMRDVLSGMFDEGQTLTEEPDGSDTGGVPEGEEGKALVYKIGIEADVRTNTLVVSGRPEQMRLIVSVIEELDQPASDVKFPIRLLTLQHADATRVGKLVEDLIEKRLEALEQVEVDGTALERERVFLNVDVPSNSLILSCSLENYAEIAEIVRQLDTRPAAAFDNIRVVACDRLSASELKDEIDELWQRRNDLRQEFEQVQDAPVIVADERSNSLLVASSLEDYEEIRRLVEALEVQPIIDDTKLYDLKFADAVALARMLEELFDGLSSQIESFEAPTIIPDVRSNALIVAGSRDAMERMDDLVARLDVEGGRKTAILQVYTLKYASAVSLSNKMQEVFDAREEGQGDERTPIVIMPDEPTNSLICSASRDDHELVVELLGLLDRPSTLAEQLEIFPLRHAKAAQAAEKLEAIFESQAQGEAGRADAIATDADERTNSLIVWASPTQMENVAELVEQLDSAVPVVERTVKLIQLRQALAEDFAQMLEETLIGDSAGADDEEAVIVSFIEQLDDGSEILRKLIRQDIKITPDPRTNSLMVWAPAESMGMLESLIRDFDRIRPVQSELRLFPLLNADAEAMLQQLEELFDTEGGAGEEVQSQLFLGGELEDINFARVGQELRFSADLRTNTLIAAGAEIDLRMVEELVRYLDSQEVEERVVEVYQARFRSADELSEALRGFNDQERDILGDTEDETSQRVLRDRQIAVESLGDPEEGSSSLIVGTSRNNYTRTMDLLHQLDSPEPQVKIAVLIAEVALTDQVELGVEIAGQSLRFSETAVLGPNGVIQGPGFDVVAGTVVDAIGSGGGFNFTVTGEDFGFLLHALQTNSRLEILSRPVLVVRNGDEGQINISDQLPVVTSTQLNPGTGQPQSSIGYEDVGIILTATPNISPDGFVTIQIEQEVSNFSNENVSLTEGVNSPIISERAVVTNVTIKDGETVVIGGLISSRISEGETKVPILGDIPYIGWLFRSTAVTENRVELLVMLTADVLVSPEEVHQASTWERDLYHFSQETLRSPLLEGLRITPDESLMGPVDKDGRKPARHRPAEPRGEQPAKQYGPKPKTYGPTISKPPTTTTTDAEPQPEDGGTKVVRKDDDEVQEAQP